MLLNMTRNGTVTGPSSFICVVLLVDWELKFSGFKLKNSSTFSIHWDTPTVNDSIWSRMYSRKALLDQQPTFMMIMTEVPDMNIAIAPPDLIEWRPISSLSNPSISTPIKATIARSLDRTWSARMRVKLFVLSENKHTSESSVDDGISRTHCTVSAQAFTGHNTSSPEWNMCIHMSRLSFFWKQIFIRTMSAFFRCGSLWLIIRLSFLNKIFPILTILVLFFSSLAVFKYSHDLMAKKIAPISNQEIALSLCDTDMSIIFRSATIGRAFCLEPSWLWYARNCSWSMKHILPSMSSRGSGRLFDRKACATYERVELTVPSTNSFLSDQEKAAFRIAWAKADIITFCWYLKNPCK